MPRFRRFLGPFALVAWLATAVAFWEARPPHLRESRQHGELLFPHDDTTYLTLANFHYPTDPAALPVLTLRDLRTGEALARYADPAVKQYRGSFSPDCKKALVQTSPKEFRVVDLAGGQAVAIQEPPEDAHCVAIAPDFSIAVVRHGSVVNGLLKVWRLDTGEPVTTLPTGGSVSILGFARDGRTFCTWHEQGVQIWDTKTWQLRRTVPPARGDIHSCDSYSAWLLSPDAGTLATIDRMGNLRLWDLATGRGSFSFGCTPAEPTPLHPATIDR